jgi:hypothetical protein
MWPEDEAPRRRFKILGVRFRIQAGTLLISLRPFASV